MRGAVDRKHLGLDCGTESFGELRGFAPVGFGQHHCEFFAADAGDQILLAYVALEHIGQLAEHAVAGEVPVLIVDPLEQVDVDHAQRQGSLVTLGAGDFLVEELGEMTPVTETGQGVVGRQLVDLFVVSGFDRGVTDELQDHLAERDVITVLEHYFKDLLLVHPGGVGRTEVCDAVIVTFSPEPTMPARHALVRQAKVSILGASNDHRIGADVDAPAQALTTDHHHAGRTLLMHARCVVRGNSLGGMGGIGDRAHP